MKRYFSLSLAAAFLLGGSFIFATSSCSKDDNQNQTSQVQAPKKKKKKDPVDTVGLPNYRYVDVEEISKNWHLAKDIQEQILILQQNLETTQNQKAKELQDYQVNAQKEMQQKQNTYTEATYKADMEKFSKTYAQMEASAQQEISKLTMNAQNKMAQLDQTMQDSLTNFIERFNMSRGYDAIFMKAATIYINPDLDITDEVLEGLNRAYNKK